MCFQQYDWLAVATSPINAPRARGGAGETPTATTDAAKGTPRGRRQTPAPAACALAPTLVAACAVAVVMAVDMASKETAAAEGGGGGGEAGRRWGRPLWVAAKAADTAASAGAA
mgnify:CR=1 FL=1